MTRRIYGRDGPERQKPPNERPYIVVDLDESAGQTMISEAIRKSGASRRVFCQMMGINDRTLRRWLSRDVKPPKMAVLGSLFVAMMSGVGVKLEHPAQHLVDLSTAAKGAS